MVRVEAKSTISAPASVLWQIMMEVDKYPQWYSVMLEASGTPRLGARLKFRVKAMDGSPRQLSFAATVVEFVPERAITLHLASNRCKYRRVGFEPLTRLINLLSTEKTAAYPDFSALRRQIFGTKKGPQNPDSSCL